jgi:hypothetical protein
VKSAYSDLFDLRSDGAWTMSKDQLIGYFRNVDKTSNIIAGRQVAVFMALRALAGHQPEGATVGKPRVTTPTKAKTSHKKVKTVDQKKLYEAAQDVESSSSKQPKGDMALTVRIEINLPAEGTRETYDAIFKSIKANLFP